MRPSSALRRLSALRPLAGGLRLHCMDDSTLADALLNLSPEVVRALDKAPVPRPSLHGDGRSRSPKRTFALGLQEAKGVPAIDANCVWTRYNNSKTDRAALLHRIGDLVRFRRWHYIGVTRYVKQRWLGTEGWKRIRSTNGFPGHCRARSEDGRLLWEKMVLLVYTPVGVTEIEKDMVEFSLRAGIFKGCRNAMDRPGGGHYSPHKPGFLYVLLSFVLDPGVAISYGHATASATTETITIDSDDDDNHDEADAAVQRPLPPLEP